MMKHTESPTNPEGLTWAEWLQAARFAAGRKRFDAQRARLMWLEGVDPAEMWFVTSNA